MNPLAFLDIESTGTDPAKDRIITLALMVGTDSIIYKFNPGMPIPEEATQCHGITNDMAKRWPTFAPSHGRAIVDSLIRCDIAGFNHINFDIPMLWEELNRVRIPWDLTNVNLIDVGNIFKKMEERTLSAAVKFYCGHQHESAHSADGDVLATSEVFEAQLKCYPELAKMDREVLAEFCRFDDRFDLAGKLVFDNDGDVAYAIGKAKGSKVRNDPGFGRWMLNQDFSEQTKLCLRAALSNQVPKRWPKPNW